MWPFRGKLRCCKGQDRTNRKDVEDDRRPEGMPVDLRDLTGSTSTGINYRECKTYIADADGSLKQLCECGRPRGWHEERGIVGPEEADNVSAVPPTGRVSRWSSTKHTRILPNTRTYGTLYFTESQQRAPYIRLDCETPMKTTWDYLTGEWHVPRPQLVIEVTGEIDRYFLQQAELKRLRTLLVGVATKADAWIFSDGLNYGDEHFVGGAVREYLLATGGFQQKIVAVGVVPWGMVEDDYLSHTQADEPVAYRRQSSALQDIYGRSKCWKRLKSSMDCYHTHFLMVDDGTVNKTEAVQPFCWKLGAFIARNCHVHTAAGKEESEKIPVIHWLLGGKVSTLYSILRLQRPVEIRTIVFQGTGHAADVIAGMGLNYHGQQYQSSTGFEKQHVVESCYEALEAKMLEVFGIPCDLPQNVIEKFLEMKAYEKMTIVSMEEVGECGIFDVALEDMHIQCQMNLCLDWEICDLASVLVTKSNRQQGDTRLKIEDINSLMFNALLKDQPEFVWFLLTRGFATEAATTQTCQWDLQTFLTADVLAELYKRITTDLATPAAVVLKTLLEENQRAHEVRRANKLKRLSRSYQNIQMKQYEHPQLLAVGRTFKYLMGHRSDNMYKVCSETSPSLMLHPWKHLFLWSIFLNRTKLAIVFLKLGQTPIGGALTASQLLKSLAKKAALYNDEDLSHDMTTSASEFEELATGTLEECYSMDTKKTSQLLVRLLDVWDNSTLLSIANSAGLMTFMAHTACQSKLTHIWDSQSKDYRWRKGQKHAFRKGVGGCIERMYGWIRPWRTPLRTFQYHLASQLLMLLLLSGVVLSDVRPVSDPDSPSVTEYAVWFWLATIMAEEVRQFMARGAKSLKYKWQGYVRSQWNRLDIAIVATTGLAIVLRLSLTGEAFLYARVAYCALLSMFYVRFFEVFYASKNLGPKVIMIKEMLMDVVFFLCLSSLFLLAYGISVHAIRYPNTGVTWQLMGNVVYMPYWQMYGELSLDELSGDFPGCSHNRSAPFDQRCPQQTTFVFLLLAVYMIMTHVLLLNLLIAMFSHTFQKVQAKSEELWKFHRFDLIHEYYFRPVLPPPLIVLAHIWRVIGHCGLLCCCEDEAQVFKRIVSNKEHGALDMLERTGLVRHLHAQTTQVEQTPGREGASSTPASGAERSRQPQHADSRQLASHLEQLTERMKQRLLKEMAKQTLLLQKMAPKAGLPPPSHIVVNRTRSNSLPPFPPLTVIDGKIIARSDPNLRHELPQERPHEEEVIPKRSGRAHLPVQVATQLKQRRPPLPPTAESTRGQRGVLPRAVAQELLSLISPSSPTNAAKTMSYVRRRKKLRRRGDGKGRQSKSRDSQPV